MRNKLINNYVRFDRWAKNIKIKFAMWDLRRTAHGWRKEVIRNNGGTVVDRATLRTIKAYARERFGSAGYWPFLALNTEIAGRYVEGWVPFDYFTYKLEPKLNPLVHSKLSEQKTFDFRLFGDFAIQPIFTYISGTYYDTNMEAVGIKEVENVLKGQQQDIVIKEEFTMGGKSVRIIPPSDYSPEMLKADRNYVIQPCVDQYKMLNDLHPDSINTLRVTTHLRSNGSVSIVFVILRFGVDGSKVDNLSSGGQFLYFDSSGKPSNCSYDRVVKSWGEQHKNTGFRFSDIKIPNYSGIIEKCKQAHKKYPYTRIIGWDVCLDAQGEPKLLEWNAYRPGTFPYDAVMGPFWPSDKDFD